MTNISQHQKPSSFHGSENLLPVMENKNKTGNGYRDGMGMGIWNGYGMGWDEYGVRWIWNGYGMRIDEIWDGYEMRWDGYGTG